MVEQDAFLWIWMGDPAQADPEQIVRWPYHSDAVNWPHKHTMYPIKAAAMLMVDNLMDLTHLGYIHVSTIGGNPRQHVEAKMDVERTPLGVRFTRWMLNSPPPPTYVKAVGFQGRIDRCQRFEFVAPGSVLQWTGATDAGGYRERQHRRQQTGVPAVPRADAGDRHVVLLLLVGGERLPPGRPTATEQFFAQVAAAFLEDKTMVEAQQARLGELGEGALVDIASDFGAPCHAPHHGTAARRGREAGAGGGVAIRRVTSTGPSSLLTLDYSTLRLRRSPRARREGDAALRAKRLNQPSSACSAVSP